LTYFTLPPLHKIETVEKTAQLITSAGLILKNLTVLLVNFRNVL